MSLLVRSAVGILWPSGRGGCQCESRLRIGLGTVIAISAEADAALIAMSGMEAAFGAIAQVESLMHPTRTGSDLLAIRLGTLGQPLAVHPWTWEVLALS